MWYVPVDLMGAAFDHNHTALGWNKKGKVVFTFARRGDAVDCHFAADKKALRHIREAINDFIAWVRKNLHWCKMILAAVATNSVDRLLNKIKFQLVTQYEGCNIYARYI